MLERQPGTIVGDTPYSTKCRNRQTEQVFPSGLALWAGLIVRSLVYEETFGFYKLLSVVDTSVPYRSIAAIRVFSSTIPGGDDVLHF